jgi:hypothetical protein
MAFHGEHQRLFGVPRFRVLVVASTHQRMESIRTRIQRKTDKLFWLTTLDEVAIGSVWAPIWVRPNSTEERALVAKDQ